MQASLENDDSEIFATANTAARFMRDELHMTPMKKRDAEQLRQIQTAMGPWLRRRTIELKMKGTYPIDVQTEENEVWTWLPIPWNQGDEENVDEARAAFGFTTFDRAAQYKRLTDLARPTMAPTARSREENERTQRNDCLCDKEVLEVTDRTEGRARETAAPTRRRNGHRAHTCECLRRREKKMWLTARGLTVRSEEGICTCGARNDEGLILVAQKTIEDTMLTLYSVLAAGMRGGAEMWWIAKAIAELRIVIVATPFSRARALVAVRGLRKARSVMWDRWYLEITGCVGAQTKR